ncbi:MAG: AMP-binding protein [Deltaproteobacteria bacterium]|nr:AMP-binding protein [Deltaproteobacteria bacterium]MBW1736339.1 AMP-binding protein [Deltaproteobacteria bacterium]MBW1909071.1 AMP-binding protein [Deltaproteobacteria bacterium]MBW2032501.1 AMP-binding protein [Deltaproteobacteria bacterium]MBW2113427.1 AMP-binding protein [Deltaproteobacteria bacterium]
MDPKETYMSKPWLKYYPEGVPEQIDIPEQSVPEIFDRVTEKYSSKIALIFYGKKMSYSTLREMVDRFATALTDLGISKGDTVALFLLNCPQYVISYFAALKVGAKVTPISPVYTSKEVKHQLEDSDAETIVCQDILYDNVEKSGVALKNVILTNIGEYLPALKRLLGKGALGKVYGEMHVPTPKFIEEAGLLQFQTLIKKYPPKPPKVTIDPGKDIAALPYTGGTTGLPKAAILTHYNMSALQAQALAFWPFFEEGNEVVIAFLPFFHIYGQVVVMLNSLVQGFTLVLFTTPDIDDILGAMDRYQASAFFGVPTLFEYLKEYEKTDRVDWKRLKMIACGADTLHESTIKEWERRTGSKILEGYGMTETTALSHGSPIDRPKTGSFGIPIPNVKAAIVDNEGTEFLLPGEVGELVLSGPNIMPGYWKRVKETEEAIIEIDGEKWLRTGDLVRMDEEGYFHFFDRKKDLIKYKGYSVFARHVEEVLFSHPQIKAAGVVGVPDPKVGHLIKAYVVLQSEARGKISEEEIVDFCKKNLAHYKVPKIIEFRGELPKTDVGKVSRRELREEGEET